MVDSVRNIKRLLGVKFVSVRVCSTMRARSIPGNLPGIPPEEAKK